MASQPSTSGARRSIAVKREQGQLVRKIPKQEANKGLQWWQAARPPPSRPIGRRRCIPAHLLTTFECVRKWRVLLDEKIAPIDANSHEIVEIEHAHPLHVGLASVGYRLQVDICTQRKECPLSYVFDVRPFVFKVFAKEAIPTRIYNACDACCEQAFHQEGRQRVLLVMWVVARGVMEP